MEPKKLYREIHLNRNRVIDTENKQVVARGRRWKKENKKHYRRTKIRIKTDFQLETVQTRRWWSNILRKKKSCKVKTFCLEPSYLS